jgi:restriction system protein
MSDTWLIRAGRQGQHEQFCLDSSTVGAGWHETPDLTDTKTRDDIRAIVEDTYGISNAAVGNYTGQLWRLRHGIKTGDTVVVPLKTTSQIAIGKVTGPYTYVADADVYRRHQIPVEWIVTDIPRTSIKQDLLFSLGSAMTICSLSRNDAAWRIQQIAEKGHDVGARPPEAGTITTTVTEQIDAEEAIEEAETLDIEQYALDRLTQVVAERFAGHAMQDLVAAVLRAEGFHTEVSPAGADGGVDVLAGSGPLGLDPPLVVGQVKSQADPVDAPVVQQLVGAVSSLGANYGLLVAWAGLNKYAKRAVEQNRLKVRVWQAKDLIEAVCRSYDRLPDEIQAKLPLKAVWVVVEGD